jgi:hypothetical protein
MRNPTTESSPLIRGMAQVLELGRVGIIVGIREMVLVRVTFIREMVVRVEMINRSKEMVVGSSSRTLLHLHRDGFLLVSFFELPLS